MALLRLELSALKPGHNRLRLSAEPTGLALPAESWPAPLEVTLDADRAGDQITVKGWVETRLADECARCLKRVEAPLDFEIVLLADRVGSGGRHEKELEQDDYVLFHDGRAIALDEEVREAALLARPMAALCRPDCRGLCPRCGADLNEGPCGCPKGGA